MRRIFLAAAVCAVSFPAFATPLPGVHAGMFLVDSGLHRIGPIDQVKPDGSVGVVLDDAYAVVPGDTLSMKDGHLATALTRKQVEALAGQHD